ncbi:restriction endonuclease subunit S [Halomonas sp. NPDC076908]|uniref:restriction endonuclease subunit S n=1 Tax=Halomonas sp. NPDC076908 TaxID=3390567 RepID=UPI003D06E996
MDAQQFLAEFGHIANAPGSVARLRELILHLAASGDLISVDNPIDASPLLESILRKKREHLETRKVIAAQEPVLRSNIKIPAHWAACRLGDLALTITGGGTPSKNNPSYWAGDIPWASVKDLKDFKFLDSTQDHITEDGLKNSSTNLIPAGRIIVCTRMGLGKVAVNRVPLAINQDLKALELPQEVNADFFVILYKTREVSGTGTTVSGIKQDKLLALPAALPPTDEQSRIVAKVDELMALCDQLEAQQQQRRTLQNQLRRVTLQAVATSQSPHELQENWERLEANFGQLFSAPEDVAAFRGLILDLAVSGNLSDIEQRHDSTGTELLETISKQRAAWSKEVEDQEKKEAQKMLRKLRTQQFNVPDTRLPEHWIWATFLQISQAVVDCHNKTAPYVASGIHLIRTTDIRNGEMKLANTKKITEETFSYWARRMPPKAGDIFFTREAPMGEAAIVPEGEKVCLGQRTMLIRLFPELFNNRFLLYVIRSPSFQTRMVEAAIGMTVKHLRVGGVEDLVVPVPPKQEQDSIVEIIDALFEVCNRFEEQLSKKQRIAANLVSSAVAALTGIAIEQEEEPMKAPKTELVSPVRLGAPPNVKAQAPLATILARRNGEMRAKDLWQHWGLDKTIDQFYAQLKTEVVNGWVLEPTVLWLKDDLNVDKICFEDKAAKLIRLIKENGEAMYENDLWRKFGQSKNAFDEQLKLEIQNGWIIQHSPAESKVLQED